MLFSAGFLSLLVASVAAQTTGFDSITSPKAGTTVATGETMNIVWESTVDGKVTITLLEGASQSTLQLGDAIATSIDSSLGTYAWTVPSSVAGYATYGFKLSLDSDPTTFQYSFPFKVTSSSSSSVASSAVSSTVVASTSSAASIVASTSTSLGLSGSASVSLVDQQQATSTVSSSAASSTVAKISTTIALASTTASSTMVSAKNVSSTITSAAASKATVVSTNSTSNFTFSTSTTKGASGSKTASSSASSSTSTIIQSSGSLPEAAVKGLSLIGALGFAIAMVM